MWYLAWRANRLINLYCSIIKNVIACIYNVQQTKAQEQRSKEKGQERTRRCYIIATGLCRPSGPFPRDKHQGNRFNPLLSSLCRCLAVVVWGQGRLLLIAYTCGASEWLCMSVRVWARTDIHNIIAPNNICTGANHNLVTPLKLCHVRFLKLEHQLPSCTHVGVAEQPHTPHWAIPVHRRET